MQTWKMRKKVKTIINPWLLHRKFLDVGEVAVVDVQAAGAEGTEDRTKNEEGVEETEEEAGKPKEVMIASLGNKRKCSRTTVNP